MNIDWVDLFFKPSGRIGQKEFWIGVAVLFVINIILTNFVDPHIGMVGQIIHILMLYPGYCVLSSRFKDMGKPPWLAILPYAILGVGYVLALVGLLGAGAAATAGSDAGAGAGLLGAGLGGLCIVVGGILALVFWIWAGVSKGDPGPNQYGPPPGDPTAKPAA
jgi:uncharacterized membrane protein YhaH (DUF805 family)